MSRRDPIVTAFRLPIEIFRQEYVGKKVVVRCADDYRRELRIDSVESDGCGGLYVSGLDEAGHRHGAYVRSSSKGK